MIPRTPGRRIVDLGREQTLVDVALAYIDTTIARRLAERDDIDLELRWLNEERRQLLDDAAAEGQRRR